MDDRDALGPPKTKAGTRSVPITPHVRKPLVALLAGKIPHPDGFVFAESDGRPLAYRSAIRRSAAAYKAVELDNWNCTRPATPCISIWAAAIRNPKKVQTLAGHASIVMTLDRYGKELGIEDDHTSAAITAFLDSHGG